MPVLRSHLRLTLAGAALLALAGLIGFWVWQPAPPVTPVAFTLAYSGSLIDTPIILAAEQGGFAEAGILATLKPYKAGKLSLDAMLRGEADLATVADTPIVVQSLQRQDFRIVASLVHFSTMQVLVRSELPVQGIAQLRGLRIGLMQGASPQFFLESITRDHGLSLDDYQQVGLRPGEFVEALQSGRVDAVVVFQPMAFETMQAMGDKLRPLEYERIRYQERFNLVARRKLPPEREAALGRLLLAIDRSTQWARSHPGEAKALVARRSGMAPELVDRLWDQHKFGVGLSQGLLNGLEAQARWALTRGLVPGAIHVPDFLPLIDPAPLRSVLRDSVSLIH